MVSPGFHPLRFLRAVVGTEPFSTYCQLRSIAFDPSGARGQEGVHVRWGRAMSSLPADTQARIELDLSHVHELAGGDGPAHLLEAAGGGALPADGIPGGAPLVLWFFLHRSPLFQEVYVQH